MQPQPTSPTRELNLRSLGALEAPTIIAPLSLIRDPPWNPLSSGALSETRSQIAPSIQSIVPDDQYTLTAIIAQPLDIDALQFENNNRDNSSKQNYDTRIEYEHLPNVALKTQGISQSQPEETSQGNSQTPQKIGSESRVESLAAQQVDNPHRRLSVGNTYLRACEREPSIQLKQYGLSGNTPSNSSVDSRALEGRSSGATRTETTQNVEINHVEGDLEHLGTLLRHLNIQPDTINYNIILTTFDEVRERAPHGTDVGETQRSSVTSASGTSSTSGNGTQSSSHSSKRSRQQYEDSDSEQHGLKRWKTSQTNRGFEGSHALSCLFYKVNPHIYSTCATFKASSISKLGAHLRTNHTGDFHCCECCRLFKIEQRKTAHQCRPIEGPCVCRILPLSRTQGVDLVERWEGIWDQLFLKLRKPRDPWWSENILREQITLANLKRIWEAGCNDSTNLDMNSIFRILSEWRDTLPDHLPDLQDLESEIARGLTPSDRGCLHRVPGASPQAVCTSRVSENAGSPNQTDGQHLDIIQAEREPNSPPILDERTKKFDSDGEDPITQLGPAGIRTLPRMQDVNSNTAFAPDFSQIFETEEAQMFEDHSTTGYTMDLLPPRDYSHVDAGGTDISNTGSDLWGNSAEDLTN
ncbi:hypothetical protein F4823DRAFT_607164 [Ustulina deusta]|nr:hypothetical protein F4823DRAFT_607164 [Ustulina deusta]